MTLAKAVVTGYVYRNPEKRFTQNNVSVSAFVLNIGDKDEMLIRVISKRTALNDIIDDISKGDKVLVEGRLQILKDAFTKLTQMVLKKCQLMQ